MTEQVRNTSLAFFVIGLLALLVLGRSRLLQDPDTFWHIAVGQQILGTQQLVYTDSYTFTFDGQPWIANQWLSECLMALCYALGGWDGLVAATAILLAGLYAWFGYRFVKQGLHPLVTAFLLTLVLAASAYNLHVRPHLTTMILFALLCGSLIDVQSQRRSIRWLAWWIPICVAWTNLHGGVLAGIATMGLAASGWTLAALIGSSSPCTGRREQIELWAIVLACAAATLVNPYGLAMHEAWMTILRLNLPELVIEHAPVKVDSLQGQMVLALALLYFVIWITSRAPLNSVTVWIPLVWFCLALTRIRHAPLFAAAAALALAEMLPRSMVGTWLRGRGWFPELKPAVNHSRQPSRLAWYVLLIPVILMAATMCSRWAVFSAQPGQNWARPHGSVWPEMMPYQIKNIIKQHGVHRIFNDQKFGGFLILNVPQSKIFIDGRCELFGEPFMRRYIEARSDPSIIRQWEVRYAFTCALTRKGSAFDKYFGNSDRWVNAQTSRQANLYVRSNSRLHSQDE